MIHIVTSEGSDNDEDYGDENREGMEEFRTYLKVFLDDATEAQSEDVIFIPCLSTSPSCQAAAMARARREV